MKRESRVDQRHMSERLREISEKTLLERDRTLPRAVLDRSSIPITFRIGLSPRWFCPSRHKHPQARKYRAERRLLRREGRRRFLRCCNAAQNRRESIPFRFFGLCPRNRGSDAGRKPTFAIMRRFASTFFDTVILHEAVEIRRRILCGKLLREFPGASIAIDPDGPFSPNCSQLLIARSKATQAITFE